jgi:cytochrome c oxidase subunit 2
MVVLMNRRAAAAGAAALATAVLTAFPTADHTQAQTRRVITVVAERFSFTPSEITIDAGETVDLHLKSDDTAHGFRIAGVVNVTVPKRGHDQLVVTIGPLAAGRYPFECSRVCGAGHHFMRGVLVVRDLAAGGEPRKQ